MAFSPSAAAPIAGGMPISVSPNASLQTVGSRCRCAGQRRPRPSSSPTPRRTRCGTGTARAVPARGDHGGARHSGHGERHPEGKLRGVDHRSRRPHRGRPRRPSGSFRPGQVTATATITDSNAVAGTGGDGCPWPTAPEARRSGWGAVGSDERRTPARPPSCPRPTRSRSRTRHRPVRAAARWSATGVTVGGTGCPDSPVTTVPVTVP